MKYITTVLGEEYEVEILNENEISLNGQVYKIDFQSVSGEPIYSLIADGRSFQAHIFEGESDDELEILLVGTLYNVMVENEREKRLKAAAGGASGSSGEFVLNSPMPGLIVKIPVADGDTVAKGDVLVILESMKMQNELKSPQDGTVSQVQVTEGESVEQKQMLLKVEAPAE